MRKKERELLRHQMELLAKESERTLQETGIDLVSGKMVEIGKLLAFDAFDGLIRLVLLAALADLVVGFFVLLVKGFGI